jgi:RNA:NAD 2'-phosphotransferase (TPT1/KptA family)
MVLARKEKYTSCTFPAYLLYAQCCSFCFFSFYFQLLFSCQMEDMEEKKKVVVRTTGDIVRISKAMSYALRHGGDKIGIPMESDGFVKVSELLMWKRLQKEGVDESLIEEIVRSNDKKRYILEKREDGLYISAAQGHSIKRVYLHQ